VPQRASSRLKLQTSEAGSSSSLVWRRWSLMQRDSCIPAEWYSANLMALVAVQGGSGAMSYPMVDHMDGYPLRHAT
jgi:hypothetical protein